MRQIAFRLVVFLVLGRHLIMMAQPQAVKSFVGTVSAFKAETAEIEIKPDHAAPVALKIGSHTLAQKIAPGEKDLKKAEAIQITEVALGDRVLVTPEPGTADLRRIIVMTATDIAKRNDADRLDWTLRGVSGVVTAKSGAEITLKMRTTMGEKLAVVTVKDMAVFKRYAPDSVKFADARNSTLVEVNVGDQLRARGQKSEDGLKVTADEVVFGSFLTKAGSVTAVNLETREVTVKDFTSNKPLLVKFTADSQLKKMPDLSGMMGGTAGGMPGGTPGGTPGGMTGGTPGTMRPSGGMDIAQMLERMPAGRLEDVKLGETIVVSSTKGAQADRITAIIFLSNAGMLIQMASMQQGGGRAGAGMSGGPSMGGGGMDLGAMGLGGIIP